MLRIPMAIVIIGLMTNTLFAQSEVEELYLRKAVKEYVAKNFDNAIQNLEQVLAANKENSKAKKLLVKCLVAKGDELLGASKIAEAEKKFAKALVLDPGNEEALAGKSSAANSLKSDSKSMQIENVTNSEPVRQAAIPSPQNQYAPPLQQQPYQPSVTTIQTVDPAIISALIKDRNDTSQIKIITELIGNIRQQQNLMNQQIVSSNQMAQSNEVSKDQYLKSLMVAVEQKNDMMKQFLFIGGGVVLAVIVLIFSLFFFVFNRYSRMNELRTLQTTDAIQALLSGPQAQQPLLLTGPNAAPSRTAASGASVEMLDAVDPIKRAQAVEVVAAEIIEPEKNSRLEKIKKLETLLKDENNRVRANAAKALYEIDKELSIKTLDDMIKSESKRMRASAMWALGEIASEETLALILSLECEDDEIVKYNKKTALEKIKALNRFPISQEQLDSIETHMKMCADIQVSK